MPHGDLAGESVRSGAISIIARAVNAIVQIGSIVFLARLLTPEDYGLVAMVTALTGFGPALVDLGTRDAVVRQVGLVEGEVSALFWITLGVGSAFALAISASGPLIASFYREPRLVVVASVLSVTFVALALGAQHQALLRRALMFRELAVIDIVANMLSAGGAIVMAWFGLGYWALVARPLALSSLSAAGAWWYCGWLPGKPVLTAGLWRMVKFGLNLSGFCLSDFVARNADRVVVGRWLGARTLGFYQNALFVYDNVLDVLVFPLHQVAVSSLSKLEHDLEELRRSWAKALLTVAFYAMPAFGILAITGADIVVLLLGAKWAAAGALLGVLALRGIAHSAERTMGWLHVAAGRADRWLRWGILATCVQVVALLCGLPFGPFGVVWTLVVSMHVLFVPALVYAGRPLGIGGRDVIGALGAPFTGTLLATGLGWALSVWLFGSVSAIERIAILVPLYLAIYLVVVVGLFQVRVPLRVGTALLRDLLNRRLVMSATSSSAVRR